MFDGVGDDDDSVIAQICQPLNRVSGVNCLTVNGHTTPGTWCLVVHVVIMQIVYLRAILFLRPIAKYQYARGCDDAEEHESRPGNESERGPSNAPLLVSGV